jgi:hypothetical protein
MSEPHILQGLSGRKPSKIKPEYAPEEFFLGDTLSERDRDRLRMKAMSLWLGLRYPLARGPKDSDRLLGVKCLISCRK